MCVSNFVSSPVLESMYPRIGTHNAYLCVSNFCSLAVFGSMRPRINTHNAHMRVSNFSSPGCLRIHVYMSTRTCAHA